MSNQFAKKVETCEWQVAKSSGNHFFRMSGRRVLTVFKKFGKWNYAAQLESGRDHYENGFATEAEAMSHAEEKFGDQAVKPEGTTPRPTPDLKVGPKVDVEPECEVTPAPRLEEEPPEITNEQPDTLSARSREDYVRAIQGQDPSPWGRVLFHLVNCSRWQFVWEVSQSTRLGSIPSVPDYEISRMLKEYDPEIIEVQKDEKNRLRVVLKEEKEE